jgi:hypothetical protein|tara:strand:- start:475 stop:702 length:228 start_codon:yes stop_codon:yes gene_type:complete
MYVKHLMEYLEKFVDEDKGNAINNARVYVERQGALHEISRIEVLENNVIGQPSILVAFKTKDDPKEILGKNHFLI